MVNKVILIGRVGKDAEQKQVGEKTLTKFSLATSTSYKDKSGQWQEKTQWHNITAWKQINALKGDTYYIEGEIEYREHEGKYYTDIICSYARKVSGNRPAESVQVEEITQPKPAFVEPDADLPF